METTEMPVPGKVIKAEPKGAKVGPPKSPIGPKYQKADSSGISIEVKEQPQPGAYDIELK